MRGLEGFGVQGLGHVVAASKSGIKNRAAVPGERSLLQKGRFKVWDLCFSLNCGHGLQKQQ